MPELIPGAAFTLWQAMRRFTATRIALGHACVSRPMSAQLEFQLARARYRALGARHRDAEPGDRERMAGSGPCTVLHSLAANRNVYLQRPDLGRRPAPDACTALGATRDLAVDGHPYDVAFVITDGLSTLAAARRAASFLQLPCARLLAQRWTIAPRSIVLQGRVAVGDDERRHCISNVRPAGQGDDEAAPRLHYLLSEAPGRELIGVELNDDTVGSVWLCRKERRNVLL